MSLPPVAPPHCALFLDFDGTLTALAAKPDAIVLASGLVPLLQRLNHGLAGALALVSGRETGVLDAYLAPLRLATAGEHGAQRRDSRGHTHRHARLDCAPVLQACEQLVSAHAGLLLEHKHSCIALHYRQAPALQALCRESLERVLKPWPQLQLLHNKDVFEVVPQGIGKGLAIAAFLNEPPFAGRMPVFIGDDTTDESGFAEVQARAGLAIKVGPGASQARHRLADVAEVHAWLQACQQHWAQRLPSQAQP